MSTSDMAMKKSGHGSTFQKEELRDEGKNSQGNAFESTKNSLIKELLSVFLHNPPPHLRVQKFATDSS